MINKKKNGKRKSLLSLSNISIQYRLPVLISILLIIVIVIFAGASYYGIRNNNLKIGYERLDEISSQFANSLAESNLRNNKSLFNLAQHNEIKKILSSGKTESESYLSDVLNTHIIPGDSLLILVQILDKNKKPVFTSLNKTNIKLDIDSVLSASAANPSIAATGKFHAVNDSIVWPWISAVVDKDEVIGYVYRLKYLKISQQTLNTFAELLGANTTFYFANDDGSVWTNLLTEVSPPPVEVNKTGILEYTNADGEDVIAKMADIKVVPWSILIERSKDVTLTTATRYLEIMAAIGMILLVSGIFLAWFMSRSITEPLNKLSVAADEISNGNYSKSVDIEQKDELGKLAASFNTMVSKVRNSQLELEEKVKSRTSELKNANVELEELNKKLKEIDELKTDFFTNVSHELRTPLALIMGPVEKLLTGRNLPAAAERDLRIIQQNARILLKQVNNLLDLSKLEVGKMEIEYSEIDLANLLRIIASYFEALAVEKRIKLKVDAPASLFIQADADKIERIIINLLSNAFKFTPEKGEIICRLTSDNSRAVLNIKDTGPGIKPELQNEIFTRYKKGNKGLARHLGSTGLGLSIVKEFIELHNGTIELKNDKGADFCLKIPLTAPEGAILHGTKIIKESEVKDTIDSYEVLKNKEGNEESFINLKPYFKPQLKTSPVILVIEDNLDLNEFIVQSLNDNYNVISAFDGEDGFEKAVKYKPDLILTDIMMPRLPGDMMISKIKSIPEMEHTPVIVLSAKSDEATKIDLLRQGVQDYLNKPFTVEELKARINNIIKVKIIKDKLQSELKSHNEDISTLVEELSDRKNLIELSLREKEVLLKEIHHRVKNNLQVISSLLNLQSNSINDPASYEVFRESQNRIKSMALIHEKLYKSKSLLQINLEEYINDLISNLCNSYSFGPGNPSIKLKIKKTVLNIDTAISLGLIINELISNSLKHAFKGNKNGEGEVHVILNNQSQDNYTLIVKDNGQGIPDDFDYRDPQTLGLRLVYSLVSQLEGDVEVVNNGGVEFKITFKAKENDLKDK